MWGFWAFNPHGWWDFIDYWANTQRALSCRFKSALVQVRKLGRDRAPHGRLFPDAEVV